jgi:Patatin-like phospholipase
MSTAPPAQAFETCRVLSLDGGGAKGFYTLGVLKEIEAMCGGGPLCQRFDLIFGTSTGAIIAALLALGSSVDDIHALYRDHVPAVMRQRTAAGKSKALEHLARTVFGNRTFTDMKTGVGIVATRWDFEKPMIFKTSAAQAHGRESTFVNALGKPTFGLARGQHWRRCVSGTETLGQGLAFQTPLERATASENPQTSTRFRWNSCGLFFSMMSRRCGSMIRSSGRKWPPI